jgi:RNA polymerase sigma-70 factor, ECF subfamily
VKSIDETQITQAVNSKHYDSALAMMYEEYHSMVYHVILRMLGNETDAEDVAQDVFIRAHRGMEKFQGKSKWGTWLYRIAVNTSLNFLDQRKRKGNWKTKLNNEFKNREETQAEKPFDEVEEVSAMQWALEQLPPKYRACVIMREIEGLSRDEICEALELGHEQLKSRLLRGRRMLAKVLEKLRKEGFYDM